MPKRKTKDPEDVAEEPRRSSRRVKVAEDKAESTPPAKAPPAVKKSKKTQKASRGPADGRDGNPQDDADNKPPLAVEKTSKPAKKSENASSTQDVVPGRQYWLMKAEPETRMEKGHDVRFSIDDLAARTEPEPWDGIRAYPARNNIRAMKKGDLAFFYHSNCKVPAIVGTMEIVEEHSPDLSAHDSSKPYYDPSSDPENPKWSVVHVVFRQKLNTPVTLKELKAWYSEKDNPLENMQMLKLARISVSKVSTEEWNFLVSQMKERGDEIKQ